MKKSKVLIPAMALLLFSTAASITGTVAWFTSTRTFETAIGNFQLAQLDGNLDCTMTPVFGVQRRSETPSDPGYNALEVKGNFLLVDASFNHSPSSLMAYRKSRDAVEPESTPTAGYYEERGALGTYAVAAKEATEGNWVYRKISSGEPSVTRTYCIGFVWTLQFSYVFNTESANVGVFLDTAKSAVTLGDLITADTGTGKDSSKGFRIAFLEEGASGTQTVYAPLADGAVTGLKYVTGTASNGTSFYTATNCLKHNQSGENASSISDGVTDGSKVSQICKITPPASGNDPRTKTVTCVAWYEGEDPNVVNGTAFYAPSIKLSFFSRNLATA